MDMLRKAFLLGLGAMRITREKAERYYDEMVEKGHISKEEARQFVEDAIKKGEEEREEMKNFIREEMKELKRDFSVVSRSEFEALEEKIKELEQKLS